MHDTRGTRCSCNIDHKFDDAARSDCARSEKLRILANSEVNTSEQKSFMGGRVCQLLPDYICPLFILLETTSRLFSLFGWGKRKRLTKAASGALALAALSLQDLISDMLNIIAQFRSVSTHIQSLIESSTSPEFGQNTLQRVVREVVSSRELTKDRVDPFLVQMRERLQSYNEDL